MAARPAAAAKPAQTDRVSPTIEPNENRAADLATEIGRAYFHALGPARLELLVSTCGSSIPS